MPPIKKFDGIDFSTYQVIEMTPDLNHLGQGFRCNRGEFQTFWKKGRVAREVISYTSKCWVIHYEDSLAGYITLLTDKLTAEGPLLSKEGISYRTFPAVKIGLLAADNRANKAGKRMVEWALEYVASEISPKIGIRFMTVDAFYDKDSAYDISGFYKKLGFMYVNPSESLPPEHSYRTMYFDLKPLIEILKDTE